MLYRQALLASAKLATRGVKRYFKPDKEQRSLNAERGSTSTAEVCRAYRIKGPAGKITRGSIYLCGKVVAWVWQKYCWGIAYRSHDTSDFYRECLEHVNSPTSSVHS